MPSAQSSSIVFFHVTKADKKRKGWRIKQRQNDNRTEPFNYSISLSLLFFYLWGEVQFPKLTWHTTCVCCSKRWEGKASYCTVVHPQEDQCHQLHCREPAEQWWRNKTGQWRVMSCGMSSHIHCQKNLLAFRRSRWVSISRFYRNVGDSVAPKKTSIQILTWVTSPMKFRKAVYTLLSHQLQRAESFLRS